MRNITHMKNNACGTHVSHANRMPHVARARVHHSIHDVNILTLCVHACKNAKHALHAHGTHAHMHGNGMRCYAHIVCAHNAA